jgi:Mg-chelatase subunit ChlI
VNLPVSATEDRVVGTLDIEQAIQKGERHFEPGVLAGANRGLLYIDEVNLLDDHVVDVLLDSAAMGVNMVEREGISFAHPARFILVGTMNPEEGELRPQLLDRFALSVEIVGIREARERVMIMERNLAYEQDAEAFRQQWKPKEDELSHQIEKGRELVDQVKVHQPRFALHRRVDRIAQRGRSPRRPGYPKAARAQAAFEGRTKINDHDIALAAELALPHRIKRTPFQQAEMTTEQLQERIEQLAGQSMPEEDEANESESQQTANPRKKKLKARR